MPILRTVVIIVVLAIVIVGGSLAYKNYTGKASTSTPPTTVKKQADTATPVSSSSYPVSPTNPKVTSISVKYTFAAAGVKNVKDTAKGLALTTSLKSLEVNAKFLVTKDTQVVFLGVNDKETPASSADLKVNQGVRIIAEYNVKTKVWKTLKVSILPATSAVSSGSSSAKTP